MNDLSRQVSLLVFWVVMPYGLAGRYQCSAGMLVSTTSPHDIITQKTNINNFTAVRTSNLLSRQVFWSSSEGCGKDDGWQAVEVQLQDTGLAEAEAQDEHTMP
jgi:hypothetical protein